MNYVPSWKKKLVQFQKYYSYNVELWEIPGFCFQIYDCVIKWVYRDLECRVTDLPSLMAHVRLPLTSEKHLAKVSEEPLICSSPKCELNKWYMKRSLNILTRIVIRHVGLEYLDEAVSFHISESIDFASMQLVRTKPRYHLIKVSYRRFTSHLYCLL